MANDVRQRMIEQTVILLARKGLDGASFSEVLAASGAPRGSLYHHFPGGKDELVLAALGLASQRATKVLDASKGKPATEVAATFIDMWRKLLTYSKFSAGCAVVAVTVAARAPELLDKAGTVFHDWRAYLAKLLAEGGIPVARAAALSATLITACEGAVAVARAERSLEAFEHVAAELLALVKSAMRPRGRRRTKS